MLISLAFYQYSTVSVVSHFRYGIVKVGVDQILVQNGHIKRLTDQDIQSSVL